MNFVNEINHFYSRMSLYELQVMKDGDGFSGLSYNSALYINVIDQMEACTVSKIAQALCVTKSAVTLKINELEKLGAVVRVRSDTDKRVFYIKLSKEMTDVMSFYHGVFGRIGEELKKSYTAEQIALFSEILHQISAFEWRKIGTGKED